MKKVYEIKAEVVDANRGMYIRDEILRRVYTTEKEAREIAAAEVKRIAARPYWWMDYAKNDINPDLPRVIIKALEVEGL